LTNSTDLFIRRKEGGMNPSKFTAGSLKNDFVDAVNTGTFFVDHEPMTERYIRASDNRHKLKRVANPLAIGTPKVDVEADDWSLEVVFWVDKKGECGWERFGKYFVVEFGYDRSDSVIYCRLFAYYDGFDSVRLYNREDAIGYMNCEYPNAYKVI
jgi:hypothetical protein